MPTSLFSYNLCTIFTDPHPVAGLILRRPPRLTSVVCGWPAPPDANQLRGVHAPARSRAEIISLDLPGAAGGANTFFTSLDPHSGQTGTSVARTSDSNRLSHLEQRKSYIGMHPPVAFATNFSNRRDTSKIGADTAQQGRLAARSERSGTTDSGQSKS